MLEGTGWGLDGAGWGPAGMGWGPEGMGCDSPGRGSRDGDGDASSQPSSQARVGKQHRSPLEEGFSVRSQSLRSDPDSEVKERAFGGAGIYFV